MLPPMGMVPPTSLRDTCPGHIIQSSPVSIRISQNQAEHPEGQILMTEKISPSIPRQMLLRCLLLKRKTGKTHSKPSRSLKLLSRSVVSNSFATPWTVADQAPLSLGFSRQEYWSGLPYPPPGGILTQGLNFHLLHCRRIFFYH